MYPTQYNEEIYTIDKGEISLYGTIGKEKRIPKEKVHYSRMSSL